MPINFENKSIFVKESEKFSEDDYWRYDEDAIVERFFKNKSSKLLILGVGAGRTIPYLFKKGFKISAIDIVPEMVDLARKKYKNISEISIMDATDLSFGDRTFDYVFFPFHGIDYVSPNFIDVVKEVSRVLNDDGIFIFNSHNRFSLDKILHFFDGKYSNHYGDFGIKTYRATPFDYFKIKKYFKNVSVIQRISLQPWSKCNWKDKCYKILPFLNKSTYFVCKNPK